MYMWVMKFITLHQRLKAMFIFNITTDFTVRHCGYCNFQVIRVRLVMKKATSYGLMRPLLGYHSTPAMAATI